MPKSDYLNDREDKRIDTKFSQNQEITAPRIQKFEKCILGDILWLTGDNFVAKIVRIRDLTTTNHAMTDLPTINLKIDNLTTDGSIRKWIWTQKKVLALI